MKANKYLVFVILFNLIGSTLCSQQVYFNNRYHLSGSESFYASTSIFEYNDNYYMTGATDDTINQSWRWVFFSIISDSGGVKSTKYLGNNANDYYPAWPGSFAEHENNFFFAGNMRYYGPFHQAGLLVKLNSNLDTIWSKEYIGDLSLPYDSNQHFNNMHICEDGSFIFTGELYYGQQPSQMVLLKADTSGNQQWVKSWPIS